MKILLKILMTLALGSMLLSSKATAADYAPPAAYDWDGPYVGALATAGWARSEHCDLFCPGDPTNPIVYSSGFGGGLEAGANMVVSSVLFGIEGDFSLTGINGSSPSTGGFGCGTGCVTNVTSFGSARLRVGLPMDNILPYITGGVGFSGVHGQLGALGADTTFVNAVAGAGIEVGLSDQISIKGEYLHVFDNGQIFNFAPTSCASGCKVEHYTADLVRIGLNYNF